jgi:predicted protein tyrosine phosphatase
MAKPNRRMRDEYGHLLSNKALHVLDIPDEYKYMDSELVELLTASVCSILDIEAQ